jgi:leucyl/phenylalanyl-tRNA--protein transferase
MIKGYTALHKQGFAHSIEAWQDGQIVGGLYGVSLGAVFYGESMYADVPDASKIAFATLLGNLVQWDFQLVDCQSYTDHLASFGAEDWPRDEFLAVLEKALEAPTRKGPWTLELGPAQAAQRWQTVDSG